MMIRADVAIAIDADDAKNGRIQWFASVRADGETRYMHGEGEDTVDSRRRAMWEVAKVFQAPAVIECYQADCPTLRKRFSGAGLRQLNHVTGHTWNLFWSLRWDETKKCRDMRDALRERATARAAGIS